MSKIYFYKMTVDDGGAPCVEDGLLSLAICKPMIRSTADLGDVLIGFAADSLHTDNRLIYIARVTCKRRHGDYFKLHQYHRRSDCIYEWRSSGFSRRVQAKYHSHPSNLVHDLGSPPTYSRASTLLSQDFCYFGGGGPSGYKKAFPKLARRIEALKQGHRVEHNPSLLTDLDQFVAENCALDGPCILGAPSSLPKSGATHRGGGCTVCERNQPC